MTDDLSRITQQREAWIDAINDGSAAGFVEVIADDAVWLPSMHKAIKGKERIRAWLEGPFAKFDYNYSVSDVRIRLAGDWAVEQAKFSTKAGTRSSGEPMPEHNGSYVVIWRRSPSQAWLIERYIDLSAEFE